MVRFFSLIVNKNRCLRTNSLVSYLSQFITVGAGIASMWLINSHMGVGMYGILSILSSTSGILINIATVRSGEAIIKFFKQEQLKQNPNNIRAIIQFGFFLDLVLSLVTTIAFFLLADIICRTFIKDSSYRELTQLYSLITLAVFIRNVPLGYFQSNEKFVLLNVLSCLENVFRVALIWGCIYFGLKSLSIIVYVYIISTSLFAIILMVLFLIAYVRRFGIKIVSWRKLIIKEYIEFSIKNFIATTLKAGSANLDNLLLAHFIDSKTVGLYQVMKNITAIITYISSPFVTLIYPKMVEFTTMGKKMQLHSLLIKINKLIILFSVILGFILILALKIIFNKFGIDYVSSQKILFIIICITTTICGLQWWVRPFSNSINQNYSLIANLIALIFQLSILVFAASKFGILGVVFSNLLLYTGLFAFWIHLYFRYYSSAPCKGLQY